MRLKYLLILIITFTTTTTVLAQDVKFVAKVSKKKLGINEKLRVDFEMNWDGDNFNPPSFKGFTKVGGPNQAISDSYINRKRSYSKTFSYFLSPTRMGNVTIGQATIEINGKTYSSNPVTVTITKEIQKPKDANDPEYVADESVHLVAEISNPNPYLNEAITVTYKLYVSKGVSVYTNFQEMESPKYADFWSQNIDTGDLKPYNGSYNGDDNYRYVILRSTLLYPQKTGKLEIEPLVLTVPIDVPTNRRDFFGRTLSNRVNKKVSAGKRTINVKPLPLEGRPEGFTDAVGQFQFDVRPNKTTLDANESLELKVQVSGKGNLKLLSLPNVKIPNSLEIYEPERSDNVKVRATGMQGSMADTYTIVPQYKGQYPIRPIPFSYFDPKTKTYKTITSKEIVIDVINGPVSNEPTQNTATTNEVVSVENQFKYIQLEGNLEKVSNDRFFKSTLFWLLLLCPFLLIPVVIVLGNLRDKRLGDVDGNRIRSRNKLAKKYLGEAKKNSHNQAAFYESLERALHNYLKAKLDIETSEMSKDRIVNLLESKEVAHSAIQEFVTLLKSCEFARYTPASSDSIQQDYTKAIGVISTIDKQI